MNRPFWIWRLLLSVVAVLASFLPVWAAEPVSLRYTIYHGSDRLALTREMIRVFEEKNPDIRIKLEVIPSYQMYIQKLMAQYAANVSPDVGYFDGSYLPFARRGALMELNNFIAKDPEVDIEEYYKNLVEGYRLNGKDYLLPCEVLLFDILFYNKRMFDEAGIPYPDGTWSWDYRVRPELKEKDFLWVVQQLTKKDAQGKTTRYGYAMNWGRNLVGAMLVSRQLQETDNPQEPRKIILNNPEAVRTYQWTSELLNKTGWMPTPTQFSTSLSSSAAQLFTQQKVAIFHGTTAEIQRFRKEIPLPEKGGFPWDITLFPRFQDQPIGHQGGGSGLGIFRTTKHPNEAWRFLKFMCGDEGLRMLGRAGATQPTKPKLTAEPGTWAIGPSTPPELRVPAHIMETDRATKALNIFNPPEYYNESRTFLETQIENIAHGRISAEEGIALGVKQAQGRLDEALKRRDKKPFPVWAGVLIAVAIVSAVLVWVYAPESGKKLNPRQKRDNRSGYLFIGSWIVGTVILTLGPMILSFLMSFSDSDIIQPPNWLGMGNYRDAVTDDPVFWVSLKVTALFTLIGVPLGLFGSLMLALLLNQNVRGIPLFRAIYYLPSLASGVAAAFIWRRIFNPDTGLLNQFIYGSDGHGNFLGLASLLAPLADRPGAPINWLGNEHTALYALNIMGLWGIGGGTVILLAGLQGIPEMYYEAATVDGAGSLRKFRNVTLPLLTPSLFFSFITGIIGSFQVFAQAFIMTGGGPNNATMFYMLNLYKRAFESLEMGYASALAWILFVIILILTLLQFRLSKWVHYES